MKIFKEYKYWWLILLAISLIISYLFPDSLSENSSTKFNLFGQVAATFIGAFVFLLIPYIISMVIKRELKGKNFMIAYSISFVFTIVLYFFI